MAIESAKYAVSRQEGVFELRNYSDAVVAVVTVEGTRSHAVNSGFRLLADYIFGNNHQKSKIAMTAPVTQNRVPTQPISKPSSADAEIYTWTVRFMMPEGYTLQTLPIPNDTRVRFESVPAHRVAAVRFSGFWSDGNLQSHETQLLRWIQQQRLTSLAPPVYAYYDPPWTPWFLRHIEVLVDVGPR